MDDQGKTHKRAVLWSDQGGSIIYRADRVKEKGAVKTFVFTAPCFLVKIGLGVIR